MAWKTNGSKFHNQKTKVGSRTFDSRKEARRYRELLLLQQAGEISGLRCQVEYELIPSMRYKDPVTRRMRTIRGAKYIADFVYYDSGNRLVVEDVKGKRTPEYRLKYKLMYWLNNILIKET